MFMGQPKISRSIIVCRPELWSYQDLRREMAKTLPLSEVKARLPELVAGVDEREEELW
jgi:hypothetical protein